MTLNSDALALVNKLRKEHGANVALGSELKTTERITSGSLALDVVLGGGWPVSQWIEIIGHESNGKTTIVYKTIAANQAINPDFTVFWLAAEHYDRETAQRLGVDNARVIVFTTIVMETAYEALLQFCKSGSVDLVVLDSYPALTPQEEIGKPMDAATMAIGARVTGQFFRKVGETMNRRDSDRPVTGIFINQWRDQIGGWSPRGTPKTTPGGKAKNYVFYVRCEVARQQYIIEPRPGHGKIPVGITMKVTTIKNKSAPPNQVATIDFYFRDAPLSGFFAGNYDVAKEFVEYAVWYDIIERGGGGYYTYGSRRWRGQDAVVADVRAELDLQSELRARILAEAAKPDRERFTS